MWSLNRSRTVFIYFQLVIGLENRWIELELKFEETCERDVIERSKERTRVAKNIESTRNRRKELIVEEWTPEDGVGGHCTGDRRFGREGETKKKKWKRGERAASGGRREAAEPWLTRREILWARAISLCPRCCSSFFSSQIGKEHGVWENPKTVGATGRLYNGSWSPIGRHLWAQPTVRRLCFIVRASSWTSIRDPSDIYTLVYVQRQNYQLYVDVLGLPAILLYDANDDVVRFAYKSADIQ